MSDHVKHSTCLSLIRGRGEHLESAEPLGAEAGLSSAGTVCPLPSVVPAGTVPHQLRLLLYLSSNKAYCAGRFWSPIHCGFCCWQRPSDLPGAGRHPFGGTHVFALPDNVIYGHTNVHFYILGLRALSLLPLSDLGSRDRVLGLCISLVLLGRAFGKEWGDI